VGCIYAGGRGDGPPYQGGQLRPPLTWLEAWSIARQELRLSDDEWLEMTPRMLYALRKRQIEQLQREELLVGILASTSANFSFCRPEKPLTPELFMLHPFPPQPEVPMTGEDIMAAFANYPNIRRVA
jgi:hypothetical protein